MAEQWQIRKPAVVGRNGMVAAQHWQAAEAGAAILKEGNAVDAAVATALALGVVEPWMCGLGGSGYAVVYKAGEEHAHTLNFQGVVPQGLRLDDYPLDPKVPISLMGFPGVQGNRNVVGYGSIAVPGAVAGLARLLESHGTLGFDRVLTPALDLARQGLAVDWYTHLQIALQMEELRRDPGANAVYLSRGCPPQPDSHLDLGALPETLRLLAEEGPESFYSGTVAERLIADLQANGSAMAMEDLAAYRVIEDPPLAGSHRGTQVVGADATSGSRRLLEALAQVQDSLAPGSEVTEATYLSYARALRQAFAAHRQRTGREPQGGCTTHLSVVDRDGNLVALTYTLLNRFGSQVLLPRTGLLMNNALGYFDPRPGYPTSLSGAKRINSSNMCPTVAYRDGVGCFAVGASGANHIVSATFMLTALLLDHGLSLEEAFHVPRIDSADAVHLQVDPRIPTAIRERLAAAFPVQEAALQVFPKRYACPSGVMRDANSGLCYGMTDPTSPIAAARAGD